MPRRARLDARPACPAEAGVEKYGIALAEVARREGVSTLTISKIMQRANK